MVANFLDGNIHEVDVFGNGEVIYYALAEGDSITVGMNRILCSDLKLRFEKRAIRNISAYVKPEAKFVPPHEWTDALQRLDGFLWRGEERPELEEVLAGSTYRENEKYVPPAPKLPKGEGKIKQEGTKPSKNVKKPEAEGQ